MHFQDPDDNHISFHTNGAAPNNAEERLPSSGGTQIGITRDVGRASGAGPMGNGTVTCCVVVAAAMHLLLICCADPNSSHRVQTAANNW